MKAKLFFVVLCMTISPMVWAQINLLVNPGAENDFEGWSMRDTLYQGGYPSPSYWSVYTDEKSCHRGTKYWASSYGKSTLVQTIDLLKLGYSTRSLDDVNPDYPGYTIFAGVYFCNTGTMTIKLELCDENDHVKSTRYVCNNEIIPYRVGWTLRSAFIRDIGTGIRKIKFYLICSGELTGKGLPGPCFDDAFVCLVGNNYVAAAESALNLKPYVGSNDTIDVFSNLDWISVVIPSWLSFTPESGNGNGTINVATAEVNNTGAPRSARINIGGKNIENHTHVVITQEAGKLSVNCNEIFLSQKADSWANFYIYSNTKWTISKSCDWLRVAKESGIGDVGNALITLSENTTGTFRTATVTITAEGANPQIIKVTQLGAAQISLSASPVSLAFGKEANNHASFDVFSNSIWQITGVPQWLKLSTTADTGNVAITATTLEDNAQIFKRSATLTLSAPGTSPVSIYVLQEASEPYLTVSPATAKMLASGSATDLLIKSNTSWTAFPGKRIVLDKLSGSGDDTLKLTVPANAFPYCYKDSIRFHPLEGEDRYVTIIQDTLQGYISRPPIAGDGSDSNPYRISTLEQLYWIAENPVRWSYHYVQIKDIDAGSTSTWFNHHGWPGIGNAGIPFTGSYDGLGHTISGIHINHDADENVGFFGYIKGATIKNLGLAIANVVGLKSTGRMAGFNQGIIENCFAAGTISGGQATGGFVGSNSGTVKNCFSFCTDKYTGGAISGGFVGENFSGGVIQYCYTSDVVAASNCNSGSFAGDIYPGSMITYCHWLSTNPGLGLDRGGMFENNSGLSTNDMRLQASFPNWDFLNESANGTDDIWGFYPSLYNGYPCFVWQLLPEVSTDSISHVDKNSAVVHAHIKLGLNKTQDAYGVCWNTTGNPTVADPKTNNGYFSENRAYADTVRSLKGNVTYYARAYATGTYGTVYGKEMSFTTILHPLAINPPQVELTKIYDGTASAQITSMGTISGIKNNDDISVSATANYDNANVAKDKTLIITYTLSGSAGNFYDAPVNDTIYNGEITARPIKVTVDPDQTKVYGEPDPVFLYSYSPELINGDVFKGALSRVTGENVGNYMIEKGSLSAGDNYHVDFIPGNFTITRKLLTCNSLIITDSKVYDGTTAVAFTPGPVTGIKAGDEVLFTATANYDNKDVGPNKNIAITYNLSGSQSDNYSIRQPEKAAGIITPAPLIITPNNIEKRIGQTYTFSGTEFSTKGLLSVDTVYSVILHSMGAEASAPLNEYDIFIDDVIGKGLNNYSLDYEQGTLTVKDKISPLITWISPKNITYGTELSNVQLNAIVIDNGTILEGLYTYNPPAGTVLNAGTGQALNVSFMPVDLINYSTANRSVNINVDKAILTASTGIYTIKEGDGLPDFLITYSGFVNCDNIGAIDVKPTAVTSYNGTGSGDYDVIVGNGSDNNYDFKYENGELVVFPKTDVEKKGLILYPNPCGNEFNINAGDSLSVLYMYDLTGKLVLTRQVSGLSRISISNLIKGVYTLKVNGREGILIKNE